MAYSINLPHFNFWSKAIHVDVAILSKLISKLRSKCMMTGVMKIPQSIL